ncbi:MAG: DUF4392 domain-containing protein [Deltaproteobacteria bacterium]|nr:DUF4392 domain-containing protein [Deltaproteobacteria bacterium]
MKILGENIDRLCTVDMRLEGQSRGIMDHFLMAAVEKVGGPVALSAAERIMAEVKRGDVVALTTGAFDTRYLPFGETDGPPGVAALARIISYGLHAKPLLLGEKETLGPVEACLKVTGLMVRDPEDAMIAPYTAMVEIYPPGEEEGQAKAREIMDRFKPKAIIAAEKIGPNKNGILHSSTGIQCSAPYARIHHLFDLAREQKVLTIGIGDNGNEIGYGTIADTVRQHKPYGDVCQCECKGGIADTTVVDVIIPANISNWGAYGVEACLAALLKDPDLMHGPEMERRMVEASVKAGACDGAFGMLRLMVDGLPMEFHMSFVHLLQAMVQNKFKVRKRDF